MRRVALLGLAACYGPGVAPDEAPDLSDTFGDVDGTLSFGEETLSFASAVAYGDSFFHGGDNVLVFTAWGNSQCEGDGPASWEGMGDGYKLDVAFEDDGDAEPTESTLWRCEDGGEGPGMCEGVAYPELALSIPALEQDLALERGVELAGSVEVTEDGVEGSLDFVVTFCGSDG